MDFRRLIRDPARIHETLVELPDHTVITKTGCKIYIPARYAEQRLALIGNEIFIFGIYAIVVGEETGENEISRSVVEPTGLISQSPRGYYGVSNACTMLNISPGFTRIVKGRDQSYYEFSFDPGTVVIRNSFAVMDDTLPYQMYREFIEMGKVPEFFAYEDMANIFISVVELAGVKLGANEAILSAIASSVMKDPDDLRRSYAFIINHIDEQLSRRYGVVPFRDVQLGATNNTAKLMGSFSDLATSSMLVNPSTRSEPMEELLRL